MRRRSSPRNRLEVRGDPTSPQSVPGSLDVSLPEGVTQWLPCLVHARTQCPGAGQRTPAGEDPSAACRQRWRDGRTTHARGTGLRGRDGQLEPCRPAHVRSRTVRRATEAALAAQAKRCAANACTQPSATRLRGTGAEHQMGGGHHVHPDRRRLAVSVRGAGPVLAQDRGLVDVLGAGPAPGAQGSDDGLLATSASQPGDPALRSRNAGWIQPVDATPG